MRNSVGKMIPCVLGFDFSPVSAEKCSPLFKTDELFLPNVYLIQHFCSKIRWWRDGDMSSHSLDKRIWNSIIERYPFPDFSIFERRF